MPTVSLALTRVKARVLRGGHNVLEAVFLPTLRAFDVQDALSSRWGCSCCLVFGLLSAFSLRRVAAQSLSTEPTALLRFVLARCERDPSKRIGVEFLYGLNFNIR